MVQIASEPLGQRFFSIKAVLVLGPVLVLDWPALVRGSLNSDINLGKWIRFNFEFGDHLILN